MPAALHGGGSQCGILHGRPHGALEGWKGFRAVEGLLRSGAWPGVQGAEVPLASHCSWLHQDRLVLS